MSNGTRLTNDEALDRILNKCKEKNIEFLGFDNDDNEYKNNKTKLILKCGKCGNTWKTTSYDKFINGNRCCPNCASNRKITEEDAIKKIAQICEERNYTFLGFVNGFINAFSKLHLKCNECGKEWKTTSYFNFIKTGRKSHSCGRNNPFSMPSSVIKNEIMISRLNKALEHSALEFVSFDEKGNIGVKDSHILLKCKKCGKINNYLYRWLLSGNSTLACKSCEFNGKISNEDAIKKITEKCEYMNYEFLGFDNDENRYINKKTYLRLKCKECGTEWNTTTFASFLHNDIKCPGCTNSWKMEKEIESTLRKYNIEFIKQCRNRTLSWLTNKISLSLDFYLPNLNVAIECQGRQHFEPVNDFGGEKSYEESIHRDTKKLNLCKEHGVKLLYYDSEHEHKEFLGEKVYNTKEEIIKEILKENG